MEYIKLEKNQIEDTVKNYGNAWLNEEIPKRQMETAVKNELQEYCKGKIFPVFDSFITLINIIKEWEKPFDKLKLIDIGCASGYYSEVLEIKNIFIQYTGIDLSSSFIRLARQCYPDKSFYVTDSKNMSDHYNKFDISCSSACLMHIPEWKKALGEIIKTSKKWVIFHRVPMTDNNESTTFYLKEGYEVKMIEIWVNQLEFEKECRKNGLKLIHTIKIDSQGRMLSYLYQKIDTLKIDNRNMTEVGKSYWIYSSKPHEQKIKAYKYKPEEIPNYKGYGWELFKDNNEIELVSPSEAQIFLLSDEFCYHTREDLYKLPYFQGNEEKHVLIDTQDKPKALNIKSIIFRCSVSKELIKSDPNTISWPYPTEDYAKYGITFDFKHQVCFYGAEDTHIRKIACESCIKSNLKTNIQLYKEFWGHLIVNNKTLSEERKKTFIAAFRDSALALAPRGGGMSSYRFFEAMSAARIPVLFADDWILPFEDEIDYSQFIIRIPEKSANQTAQILSDFFQEHSKEEIVKMGQQARKIWENYFDCRKWADIMMRQIKKKILK